MTELEAARVLRYVRERAPEERDQEGDEVVKFHEPKDRPLVHAVRDPRLASHSARPTGSGTRRGR